VTGTTASTNLGAVTARIPPVGGGRSGDRPAPSVEVWGRRRVSVVIHDSALVTLYLLLAELHAYRQAWPEVLPTVDHGFHRSLTEYVTRA
jgi:hypothetical protein